ncbi:MAG TPA: PsbP-related protein [Nitrososphaeraceae archaeon]|nr:PsbP-related protein [Nitrososphaeraceae archaeon]
MFAISDTLILQPKIGFAFASSPEGEDDDDEDNDENSNVETLLGASDGSDTSDAAESFLPYNNSEYGIKINYPSDWSYQEVQAPSDATIIPILNMFPPISDDPDAVSFLEIGLEELETPFSIDEYSRSIINGYRESRLNFDLVSSSTDDTLSGLPAYEIVFTDSANGTDRKIMEVGALDSDNNRVYYLLFNTEESRYEQFVPALESMIDSFQLSSISKDNIIARNISDNMQDGSTINATTTTTTQSSSPPSPDTIENNNVLLYENSSYGISVQYPATWIQFHPISDPESRTTFITQFEPIDVSGITLFAVARDTFSLNETLDTYLAETVQSYRGNTLNFTLISTAISPDLATPPLLAGNPAYSLLYTHTSPDSEAMLLTQEIGTIIPETSMVYYVYYTADIPNYNQFIDDAVSIANSLEIHLTNLNTTESEETNILEILESLQSGEI